MNRYRFCGLTIASELPLATAQPAPASDARCDVVVRWLREPCPQAMQSGEPVVSELIANWGGVTRNAHGYLLAYRETCAFVVSLDGLRVDAYVPGERDREWAGHLFVGTTVALLIALRGALALHASAVAFGADALAIAGPSGAGKSTLAAWLVREGGALLADDILRVHPGSRSASCEAGAVELRMRSDVALPVDAASAPPVTRTSYDGRQVLRASRSGTHGAVLRALVCPELTGSGEPPRLHALSGVEAFRALARSVRPSDVLVPDLRATQFRQLAALLRTVPVYALRGAWHEREILAALRTLRPPELASASAVAAQTWSGP